MSFSGCGFLLNLLNSFELCDGPVVYESIWSTW